MKRLLLLLILSILISPQFIQSQSVMVACGSPVTTLTQCVGTFADTGGTGNYANNCAVTQSICAGIAGQCVTLQFTSFNLDNNWEFLRIYNGPTACNNIFNNTLAPVRCNCNFPCESYTGIGTPLPAGVEAGNFEPELNVTCGQKFLICPSNYSSASAHCV